MSTGIRKPEGRLLVQIDLRNCSSCNCIRNEILYLLETPRPCCENKVKPPLVQPGWVQKIRVRIPLGPVANACELNRYECHLRPPCVVQGGSVRVTGLRGGKRRTGQNALQSSSKVGVPFSGYWLETAKLASQTSSSASLLTHKVFTAHWHACANKQTSRLRCILALFPRQPSLSTIHRQLVVSSCLPIRLQASAKSVHAGPGVNLVAGLVVRSRYVSKGPSSDLETAETGVILVRT
ncbi:unnamed protein product [Protopolystoma xenopodis]|uniref:Uncharacterized protein n=1 Tax=Protopolystoma xenopodis TaxID=117903 RepID=A0A3S5BDF5_9PLAT|nr:unnamed protein product [Protopolystoma xenopodis]